MAEIEEWRDTHIFGERYEVSNFGRVRSKAFIKKTKNMHGAISYPAGNKILTLSINDGYYCVRVSFNGQKKTLITTKGLICVNLYTILRRQGFLMTVM